MHPVSYTHLDVYKRQSQYGANAMAREGSDFEEILTWYYTGTEVGELYGAAGE